MNWTEEDLQAYRLRREKSKFAHSGYVPLAGHTLSRSDSDNGSEAKLQAKIEKWLSEHGFYFFHDRSRGKNTAGNPDLVIAGPGGRAIWIELKSKSGRLSEEQKKVRLKIMSCGHEWHEIRSFRGFLQVMEGKE